jgi:flagellar assembly factor FliW
MAAVSFESSRFGTVEVDPDAVIEFPRGLIGLGGSRFALLGNLEEQAIVWLHATDDPDLDGAKAGALEGDGGHVEPRR